MVVAHARGTYHSVKSHFKSICTPDGCNISKALFYPAKYFSHVHPVERSWGLALCYGTTVCGLGPGWRPREQHSTAGTRFPKGNHQTLSCLRYFASSTCVIVGFAMVNSQSPSFGIPMLCIGTWTYSAVLEALLRIDDFKDFNFGSEDGPHTATSRSLETTF